MTDGATLAVRPVGARQRPRKIAVSVRNLGKRYWLKDARPTTFQQVLVTMARGVGSKPFCALRGVSFDVYPGESVGIIGANGAGNHARYRYQLGFALIKGGDEPRGARELRRALQLDPSLPEAAEARAALRSGR